MKFLIVSGMSGAGKSRAADILEDMNYYCVDNMPAVLIPRFAEFCMGMSGRYERVALVTDIRDKSGADAIFDALGKLRELGCEYSILFVEADVPSIVRRYKESRRPHPLQAEAGSLEGAVNLERSRLERLRESADYVINTGSFTLGRLQEEIFGLFSEETGGERKLNVCVQSFGYKYGIPLEADLVLDVRFLPNPYYVTELRPLTGLDEQVSAYVLDNEDAAEFLQKTEDLLAYLLPRYLREGKHSLTVAVGCTGGRHRSVAVAAALMEFFRGLGQSARIIHRDVEK